VVPLRLAGPLVLKGILAAEDARLAVHHGADAIVVSNHGGRQLDGASGAIEALPQIADAVNGRADVIVDGGVRTGRDIVIALGLGASACMAGRPIVYGVAAAGERGATRALDILRDELDRTLALLGLRSVAEVTRAALTDTAVSDGPREGVPAHARAAHSCRSTAAGSACIARRAGM
jgi:isopentenyl diphosphate isomerase/L-lactate dehydrogenase-like FMN-dependent dehydrogenase